MKKRNIIITICVVILLAVIAVPVGICANSNSGKDRGAANTDLEIGIVTNRPMANDVAQGADSAANNSTHSGTDVADVREYPHMYADFDTARNDAMDQYSNSIDCPLCSSSQMAKETWEGSSARKVCEGEVSFAEEANLSISAPDPFDYVSLEAYAKLMGGQIVHDAGAPFWYFSDGSAIRIHKHASGVFRVEYYGHYCAHSYRTGKTGEITARTALLRVLQAQCYVTPDEIYKDYDLVVTNDSAVEIFKDGVLYEIKGAETELRRGIFTGGEISLAAKCGNQTIIEERAGGGFRYWHYEVGGFFYPQPLFWSEKRAKAGTDESGHIFVNSDDGSLHFVFNEDGEKVEPKSELPNPVQERVGSVE